MNHGIGAGTNLQPRGYKFAAARHVHVRVRIGDNGATGSIDNLAVNAR